MASRVWAVSSGWEGPFQLEEVLVIAPDAATAQERAESRFSEAGQPVCRAKVRVADLGDASEGLLVGPRRSGEQWSAEGVQLAQRCDPPPSSDPD